MKRKKKKNFRKCKKGKYIVAYIGGLPIMYKSNHADEVITRHGYITPRIDRSFRTAGAAWDHLQSCTPIIPDQDCEESDDCLWWDSYDE